MIRTGQGHSIVFVQSERLSLGIFGYIGLSRAGTAVCHVTNYDEERFNAIMSCGIMAQCKVVSGLAYGGRFGIYLSLVGPSDPLYEQAAGERNRRQGKRSW